jgi:hypothetical protein
LDDQRNPTATDFDRREIEPVAERLQETIILDDLAVDLERVGGFALHVLCGRLIGRDRYQALNDRQVLMPPGILEVQGCGEETRAGWQIGRSGQESRSPVAGGLWYELSIGLQQIPVDRHGQSVVDRGASAAIANPTWSPLSSARR